MLSNVVPPIEAISERDIDLLLLEDMYASPTFVGWLVTKVFGHDIAFGEVISANHSIFDEEGESDIVLQFRDRMGVSCALLIENKVAAPPQPDQAARYRIRAETGAKDGKWEKWKTAIIAPAAYLEVKADGYDARISYEDIACWYEVTPHDARAAYRARIMRDAIVRARRVGISRVDPVITAFWKMYHADSRLLFPELKMKDPGDKGPNSTWIQFRPTRLGSGRALDHKLLRGCLDLSFWGVRSELLDELRPRWNTLLVSHDATVEATGGSLAVRAVVPVVNPRDDYSSQQQAARAGMKAAYRLLYLSGLLRVDDLEYTK
jgi:hypothetical protein